MNQRQNSKRLKSVYSMASVILIALSLFLTACQSTALNSDRTLVEFEDEINDDTIHLNVYNLNSKNKSSNQITVIDADSLRVEAKINEELLDHGFKIALTRGELTIKTDSKQSYSNLDLDITVYAPVDRLTIEGAFKIVYDRPSVDSLTAVLDGAGELDLTRVTTDYLSVTMVGAGDFYLSGETKVLSAKVVGAGAINALDLQAKDADIEIDGAGSIDVNASDKLHASLNGMGDIRYAGQPFLTRVVNGLGSIKPID